MSTEGTIAAVVMLIAGIAWLALPILRRRFAASADELAKQKERDALTTVYERTLASLRDVEEDHLTGKLAQADYEAERAHWMEQGVAVLQALEERGGKKPAKLRKALAADQPAAGKDADAMLDEAIEQTIANYIKSTR
ncbi:MAG: hypothetical protein IT319_15190 [Anaerolineae bacterium]|nr:hypothetical protein [Anaerolineae bacterium]